MESIEKNPCGICRASGRPVCNGHAPNTRGRLANRTFPAATNDIISMSALEIQLAESTDWEKPDRSEPTFIYHNKYAFFTPYLDLKNHTLRFDAPNYFGKKQIILDDFLQEIIDEFIAFKAELKKRGIPVDQMRIHHGGNKLTISIPNPHYYSAFIQRLIEKNMLPVIQSAKQYENTQGTTGIKRNQPYNTALTPFKTNRPRPRSF